MITAYDVLANKTYREQVAKTLNSEGWAILMEVAKGTGFMRPPDPRLQKPDFGGVDTNHVAPILYGIALGKWEMVDMLSSLHIAEDVSKLNPPEETYGADAILSQDEEYVKWKEQQKAKQQKLKGNSNART